MILKHAIQLLLAHSQSSASITLSSSRTSAFCLFGFACSEHFLEMESYGGWPSMCGSFTQSHISRFIHSVECIGSSSLYGWVRIWWVDGTHLGYHVSFYCYNRHYFCYFYYNCWECLHKRMENCLEKENGWTQRDTHVGSNPKSLTV